LPRSQLAINCPAPLLERLRAEAQRQQATATSLVLAWIEAGLDGRLEASSPAPSSQLEQRLDAVEQRLGALERSPKASPIRVMVDPLPEQVLSPKRTELPPLTGAVTTAELAEQTGTNRAAWNNWAKPERIGQVRHHPQAGSWRLMGKAAPPNGGPERWLWEPA